MPLNFHKPEPGQTAIYYCPKCKKSFSAKVPDKLSSLAKWGLQAAVTESPADILMGKVKCPDCHTPCGLDNKVRY